MPPIKRFQFSLWWVFALVLVMSLISGLYDHYVRLHMVKDGTYTIVVDYSDNFQNKIKNSNLEWVDPYIVPANFPLGPGKSGKEKIEMDIVHFDKPVSPGEIVQFLNSKDLRSANPFELLTFWEQCWDPKLDEEQWTFKVYLDLIEQTKMGYGYVSFMIMPRPNRDRIALGTLAYTELNEHHYFLVLHK